MKEQTLNSSVQSEFLQAFVLECMKQLMIKNKSLLAVEKPEPREQINEIMKKQVLKTANIKLPAQIQIPSPATSQVRSTQRPMQLPPRQMQPPLLRPQQPLQMPRGKPQITQRPMQRPTMQTAPPIAAPPILGMEKIEPMLNDPSVISVECPGQDRPILVNKSGAIQTTSLVLTSDEIKKLMNEISKTTKIPLMSGIFKAAFGKYIVTAVVSDFVGTRFVIQKKSPFQPMQ